MKFIFLFIVWICLWGCVNSEDRNILTLNDFYLKTSNRWMTGLNLILRVENGLIDKPIGGEILLFEMSFLDGSNQKMIHDCLYYLVPFKKIQGEISLYENKDGVKCSETPFGKLLFKTSAIKSLKINFENFQLSLKVKRENEDRELHYPLINIKNGVVHERFKPIWEKKLMNGAMIFNSDSEVNLTHMSNYIGHLEDSYSNKTAIQCLKLNSKCEVVGEDFCYRCKYGVFEVVDYQCPQGGSRFCGINHCGEKNEPACIRGLKTLDDEFDGICNNNLRPVLNGDHILVCQ